MTFLNSAFSTNDVGNWGKSWGEGANRRTSSHQRAEDESSFYTVANVPFGLASNLCVGRFSEINKILLYNRGYEMIKRVRIPTEKKSPQITFDK